MESKIITILEKIMISKLILILNISKQIYLSNISTINSKIENLNNITIFNNSILKNLINFLYVKLWAYQYHLVNSHKFFLSQQIIKKICFY